MRNYVWLVLWVGTLIVVSQVYGGGSQVPGPPTNLRIEGNVTVVNDTNCTITLSAGGEKGPWQQATIDLDVVQVPVIIFRQPMLRIAISKCR